MSMKKVASIADLKLMFHRNERADELANLGIAALREKGL